MSYFKNGTNSGLPEVGAPTEPQYAGFRRRVAAHLIDAFAFGLALIAIILITLGNNSLYSLTLVVPGVFSIIYQLYLTTKYGATLGKMVMGIQIVRLDGSPIGFAQAHLRYFPYLILGLISVLGDIEAFNNIPVPSIFFEHGLHERTRLLQQYQPTWVLLSTRVGLFFLLADSIALVISKKKLSVHDLIAGTMVIKTDKPTHQ